jgi:hypothetical protein
MTARPALRPTYSGRDPTNLDAMEIIEILSTAAIVIGVVVTVLIAVIPTLVDR